MDGSNNYKATCTYTMLRNNHVAICRGARVHSDSWATGVSTYDSYANGVDTFSYLFQDFLPVFAAGNNGATQLDSSVESPAVSKNCLSVGALIIPYQFLTGDPL